jgi:SAM-dependent methyltransferase
MKRSSSSSPVASGQWPEEMLESVPNCPVCKGSKRTILHDNLSDQTFFVAPGQWTLWNCSSCRSAWLDPRPTESSIGRAYARYYTHEAAPELAPPRRFRRVFRILADGYRKYRFGVAASPAPVVGFWAAMLLPPYQWSLDAHYRYLPAPNGQTRRILDVGCGNGAFLELARRAGWQVAGVEPDPVAAARAAEREIEIRHRLDDWLHNGPAFDFATVSHVLEHVHEPPRLLETLFNLLRPGGGIFLETPNIESVGHSIYGRDWRGLEAPRHLVIFNRESLTNALSRSGFEDIRMHPRMDTFPTTWLESRRMAAGVGPMGPEPAVAKQSTPSLRHKLRAISGPRAEFLTATAMKPQ